MALISIDDVKEGLVLDKEVKNGHGQLLLQAGVKLTERHVNMLRAWGIPEVVVRGGGPSRREVLELQDIRPEDFAKAEVSLREKFARVMLTEPVMQELFRQCATRKAKALYG